MVKRKENDLSAKGVSSGFQLEHALRDTLVKHGYTSYWNGVCIQPGDKKSKTQQIKILFNN